MLESEVKINKLIGKVKNDSCSTYAKTEYIPPNRQLVKVKRFPRFIPPIKLDKNRPTANY